MPVQFRDRVVNNFSKGITGDPLKPIDGQVAKADNLFLTKHGSLKTRFGCDKYTTSGYLGTNASVVTSVMKTNNHYIATNDSLELYAIEKGVDELGSAPTITQITTDLDISNSTYRGAEWRGQLYASSNSRSFPIHLVHTGNGPVTYSAGSVGLRPHSDNWSVAVTGTGGSYLVALVYVVEYTDVNGISFKLFSSRNQKRILDAGSASTFTFGATEAYTSQTAEEPIGGSANVKVYVYRSKYNGSTLYKVAECAAGDTPVTAITDAQIEQYPTIPSDSFVDFHMPPKCKDVIIFNNTAYYLNVETAYMNSANTSNASYTNVVGGYNEKEIRPYRFYQSIPSIPTVTNGSFFKDLDDDIVGGGTTNNALIVFTNTYIYRIEGQLSADGRGNIRAVPISNSIGCVSRDSIVSTPDYVYFAGTDGFYITDGSSIKEITGGEKELQNKYLQLSLDKCCGTIDYQNNRVFWAAKSGSGETYNNVWWVYDIDRDAFTTCSGVSNNIVDNLYGNVLLANAGAIYRSTKHGLLMKHAEYYDYDYNIPKGIKTHIEIDFLSAADHFQDSYTRKWIPSVSVTLESSLDIAVQPYSVNDDGRAVDMSPMVYKAPHTWGDSSDFWGNKDNLWYPRSIKTLTRRFPRGHFRCRTKQLGLSSASIDIRGSEQLGNCAVALNGLNEIIVTLAANVYFPKDVEFMILELEIGEPAKSIHTIKSVTIDGSGNATQLVCTNASLSVGGTFGWKIYGKPVRHDTEIKAISYKFGYLNESGAGYSKDVEMTSG